MLLFAAQLIHIICATVGYGDGEAKQAVFQEIMSSLLPQQTEKNSLLCRDSEFTCNMEPICSVYLHFSWAVTFESNESMALNSLLMRIKAKTDICFEDGGKSPGKSRLDFRWFQFCHQE